MKTVVVITYNQGALHRLHWSGPLGLNLSEVAPVLKRV